MKRVFIYFLFLLLPMHLFALDKSEIDTKLQNAVSAYKNREFEKSYEILSKLYLYRLSDPGINFYLGRSAYESGHYEAALAAFERVEMIDPANIVNKLQMARTYFMLKMYEDSELAFKEVLANQNIPQNVRTNIELSLSKVSKVQQRSFTYATLGVDYIYDSNVNYASLNDTYDIGSVSVPSPKKLSDSAAQINGDIVNIYDVGDKGDFAIKNQLSLFMKSYFKESAYNLQYLGYMPSILYKSRKYTAEFAIGADMLKVDNTDYLNTFYVMPRYEYYHTNTLRSLIYAKYQNKRFRRSRDTILDAHHYELSYGLQSILTPRSYVQGNVFAVAERKQKSSTSAVVDYNEYKANMVYANQLTPIFSTQLFGEYRYKTYADRSSLFDSKRVDNTGVVSAELRVRIIPKLNFRVKGAYSRVESNQDVYSYEKYTVTAGIAKTF